MARRIRAPFIFKLYVPRPYMETLLYILAREMGNRLPVPPPSLEPSFAVLSLGDNHLGYEYYCKMPDEEKRVEERLRAAGGSASRSYLNELARLRTSLFGVEPIRGILHRESVAVNEARARYLRKEPCSILRGRVELNPVDRRVVNAIRAHQEPNQPCLL